MNPNDHNEQQHFTEIDQQYQKCLSRYFGINPFGSREKSIQRIKAMLKNALFPTDPMTAYNLGKFIYLEIHEDDLSKEWLAICLFVQASCAGIAEAQAMLATIMKEHRHYAMQGSMISQALLWRYLMLTNPDDPEIGKWLCRAADQFDPESEYTVSICSLSGLCGIVKDIEKAVHYTQRAVDHGYPFAAYNLGCFYANGTHVKQDTELARYYWDMAKTAGHPDAQKAIDELSSKDMATPNPNDELTTKIETMISNIKQSLELLSLGQAEIIQTTKNESDRTREDITRQHTLTRNTLHMESERISQALAVIEDHIIRQIFNNLNEAVDNYRNSLAKFEALQKIMSALKDDVYSLSQSVKKSDTQLVSILEAANMTADQLDDLSSQMQQFFERMEAQSIKQAANTALTDLRSVYSIELEKLFGDYWNDHHLLGTTKESLIAARVLLACAEREGIWDCRGIVISATSALERELKARFYTGIRNYFQETGIWDGTSESDLPSNLQQKLKTAEDKFTLGDVRFILSCEDYYTRIPKPGYTTEQVTALRSYLRDRILPEDILTGKHVHNGKPYNDNRPEDIFIFNGKPCFTDKLISITNNYRNPAAHTSDTPKEIARQCCDDVIGQSKSDLSNIEGLLLELLKLTSCYKHE